jgi:hypothetical protein
MAVAQVRHAVQKGLQHEPQHEGKGAAESLQVPASILATHCCHGSCPPLPSHSAMLGYPG